MVAVYLICLVYCRLEARVRVHNTVRIKVKVEVSVRVRFKFKLRVLISLRFMTKQVIEVMRPKENGCKKIGSNKYE